MELCRYGVNVQISNRSFGVQMAIVLAVVGVIDWALGWEFMIRSELFFYGAAVAFLVAALLVPNSLRLLNRGWAGLSWLLAFLLQPIFLGLIFMVIVVPVGLLRRALRVDELQLRRPTHESMWTPRDPISDYSKYFSQTY